jgi:hypothetical protein
MSKLISAIAVSAFIAPALFVLPGFAPPLEARLALKKGDRLVNRGVAPDCTKQDWPNFSAACLHGDGEIHAVRIIGVRADRKIDS